LKPVKKIDIIYFTLFFISFILCGCKKEPEIDRSTLVKIYVETTLAQSKYASYPDSLRSAKEKIYSKYNVAEEDYYSTLKSIEPKAEYWDGFYKEVKSYMDSLKVRGSFD